MKGTVGLILLFVMLIFSASLDYSCQNKKDDVSTPTENVAPVKLSEIGVVIPLSGEVASYGQRAQRGMQLAQKDWKAHGKPEIGLIFEDDQSETSKAVTATQKLIDINKVPVVVGSAASSVTMGMTTVGNQRHVVIFSPIASSPELSSKGGSFFFRVAPSDTAQAKIMADWFKEKGIKKIAVLYASDTWGQSLFEAIKTYHGQNGGTIVAEEGIQKGQTEFRTQLTKFKTTGADAFYAIVYPKDGGAFFKQAKQLKITTSVYGGDVWISPEFVEVAGSAAEGAFFVAPAKLSGTKFDQFVAAYKQAYGEDPEVYAAYSYDTFMVLANAIQSGARTGEAIRVYLSKMPPYDGVSGSFQFDAHGDVIGKGFDRFTIQAGKPAKVSQ